MPPLVQPTASTAQRRGAGSDHNFWNTCTTHANWRVALKLKSPYRDGTPTSSAPAGVHATPGCPGAAPAAAANPVSQGACPERKAACSGHPTGAPEGQRPRVRGRARPGVPDARGAAAQARVPHPRGALRVRWAVEDPSWDRRASRDREESHAPALGRTGVAARCGAGVFARLRSLTRQQDDGFAAELTEELGLSSREGVESRRVSADPGQSRACIVTARGDSAPCGARLTAQGTIKAVPARRKRRLKFLFAHRPHCRPLRQG